MDTKDSQLNQLSGAEADSDVESIQTQLVCDTIDALRAERDALRREYSIVARQWHSANHKGEFKHCSILGCYTAQGLTRFPAQ